MECLIGMDGLMSDGANVGQTVTEKDVYENWNCLRMNMIWNDVELVACKTNYWDKWWGGILPQERKSPSLILKINSGMKMERNWKTTKKNDTLLLSHKNQQ